MAISTEEFRSIEQVTERLRCRFPGLRPETVRSAVDMVHHQYDGRPIREFVPVLVEREVKDVLEVENGRGARV